MYAVIRKGGHQFRMEPGAVVTLPTLDAKVGESVELDEVLLGGEGEEIKLGAPIVEGAKVTVEVLRHGLDRKLTIGKLKRRKGYRRRLGHRQGFTQVRVSDITLG